MLYVYIQLYCYFTFSHQFFFLPVACHDIDQWPCPVPGDTLNLPIMGTVIQVSVCVYMSLCVIHHGYSNLSQRVCVCQTACSTFPSWGQLYRSESVWLSVWVWTAACSTSPSWGQLYRSVCVCVSYNMLNLSIMGTVI